MIEVALVIIILGILAAAVFSTGGSPLEESRRANAEALRSHIRLAQSRAMKTGATWGINCDGASYWLFTGNDATVSTPLPGVDTGSVTLADRNVALGAFTVAFNTVGQPFTDAGLTTPVAAGGLSLTMTGDGFSATLTITAETGYVQ